MGNDHEDYETGAAPAAHKVSHQDGGTDEISVAGLSGETAALAAHKILPAIHHVKFTAAEARAAINNIFGADGKSDAHINMDTHYIQNLRDPFAPQDAVTWLAAQGLITGHAGLPTVHQDAPALILDHKGDASAHHAKYTDAEVRAVFNPLSLPPSSFLPYLDTYDFHRTEFVLKNRTSLTLQSFYAPVYLPDGCTVTKVTLYGFRNDALSSMILYLFRTDRTNVRVVMAAITSNWTDNYGSLYDETINSPVIDNAGYQYTLLLQLDPNDSVDDCQLTGVKIEFTG